MRSLFLLPLLWSTTFAVTKEDVVASLREGLGAVYKNESHFPHSANMILRGNDGNYLLFQEKWIPGGRCWSYPGGATEKKDKSDVEAALREFEEEAGFPLADMIAYHVNWLNKFVGFTEDFTDLPSFLKVHRVGKFLFLIEVNCPLKTFLTHYPGQGPMHAVKIPGSDPSVTLANSDIETFHVGKKAQGSEGDYVAIATLQQIESAGVKFRQGDSSKPPETEDMYSKAFLNAGKTKCKPVPAPGKKANASSGAPSWTWTHEHTLPENEGMDMAHMGESPFGKDLSIDELKKECEKVSEIVGFAHHPKHGYWLRGQGVSTKKWIPQKDLPKYEKQGFTFYYINERA